MKRFLLLVAFVSSVSFADTNDVFSALEDLQNTLSSISSQVTTISDEVTGNTGNGGGVWYALWQIDFDIGELMNRASYIEDILRNTITRQLANLADIRNSLISVNSNLVTINNTLKSFDSITNDVSAIHSLLQTVNVNIAASKSSLQAISQYVYNIYTLLNTQLPYLSSVVSNINNIISDIGVTVNFPSPFNVRVDNFSDVNFNPVWDWQNKYINGTGEASSETLVWQNSLDLTDNRSTRFRLFPDMHNDVSFASWAGMLYKGLDNGFESLSSSGVRSVLLLNSISNINAQIYSLLSGLSPNTNLVATTDEQTEAASTLRSEKLTTDSLTSEISSIDYTPNIYAESIPNIGSRPRLSGVVSAHDTLSESSGFDLGLSGFFQTATDMGYTQFSHPDTTVNIDMRPANDVCIAVRQVVLLIFWIITIIIGSKLCLTVYSLYQTIWVSLMSSDSDIGAGQTVNTINYMRHILP